MAASTRLGVTGLKTKNYAIFQLMRTLLYEQER